MEDNTERLKKLVEQIARAEDELNKDLRKEFEGKRLRITASFWNGQCWGGTSRPNLSGKIFLIKDAFLFDGRILLTIEKEDVCGIELDKVEILP